MARVEIGEMASREQDMCTCGHRREAHEHYRAGTDCGLCQARECEGFTRADGLAGKARSWWSKLRSSS